MSDIQAQTDLTFVRQEIAASEPPPRSMVGPIGWMRRNLFASVGDTLLTIVGLLLVLYFLPPLLSWAFFDAVWHGSNRDVCISPDAGACWAFIKAKFPQFIYGRYPLGERWRVDIVFFLLAAGILPMAIPSVPYKALNGIFLVAIFPVIAFILLAGGHVTFSPLVGAVVYLVLLAAVLALAIRLVRARPDDVWLRMAVALLLAFSAISVLGYVVQGVAFGSVVPGWAMFTLLALQAVCLLALIALFIVLILVPNGLPAARALATSIGPILLAAVDRKSTRLNSCHSQISYAVFCLKKKSSELSFKVITNNDLEKMIETSDEWITVRTGIKQRDIRKVGKINADMAFHAAMWALDVVR